MLALLPQTAKSYTLIGHPQETANGIEFTIGFVFANTGKHPAGRISVFLRTNNGIPNDMAGEQRKNCRLSTLDGQSVFPGQETPGGFNYGTYLAKADIPKNEDAVMPLTIACVSYIDIITGQEHHTPYVFQLGAVKMIDGQLRMCCAIPLDKAEFAKSNIVLSPFPIDTIAAD